MAKKKKKKTPVTGILFEEDPQAMKQAIEACERIARKFLRKGG